MQQIMTIKELMGQFGMELTRKNSLKLLKVLKKLQSDEKLEIIRKIGKCYFVITPNIKSAFPSLFESLESENCPSSKKLLKRELLDESEKKITSALHEYSGVLRQLERKNIELTKEISKMEKRLVYVEGDMLTLIQRIKTLESKIT